MQLKKKKRKVGVGVGVGVGVVQKKNILMKKLCIAHQLTVERGKTVAYEKLQHMRSCVFQNNKTYSRSCVYHINEF